MARRRIIASVLLSICCSFAFSLGFFYRMGAKLSDEPLALACLIIVVGAAFYVLFQAIWDIDQKPRGEARLQRIKSPKKPVFLLQ